jgi:thiosulfate/3-mercaptopyruvate sulfurtransferase
MTARETLPLTFLALALSTSTALAAPEGWSQLLEPSELATILEREDGIRVVQVSGDYSKGHIPHSVATQYGDWRGPAENPGALREFSHYRSLVQQLGIEADTPVVVVHEGSNPTNMGAAARVYWTLKSLGVKDLALLNGGLEGWKAADLPLETSSVAVPASAWEPEWSDAWRVSTEEVEMHVENGGARLIDARPVDFFQGITWTIAKPGTIPAAGNLTYETWFDGNRMVDGAAARRIAREYGHTDAPLTVSFCNTGHWAAINWFALSELAEVDNTRLYAESMAEWTKADRPIANQPGAFTYYWLSTKRWVSDLFS